MQSGNYTKFVLFLKCYWKQLERKLQIRSFMGCKNLCWQAAVVKHFRNGDNRYAISSMIPIYLKFKSDDKNAMYFSDGISERSSASKRKRNFYFLKTNTEPFWYEIRKADTTTTLYQVIWSPQTEPTYSNDMRLCFPVRDGDTVKHYRIRQLDEGGFFIARRTTFRTLQELVEHYSKDPDGLCVNLCKPCVQVSHIKSIRHRIKW